MTYREALDMLRRCPPNEGWHISCRRDDKARLQWAVVTESL